MVLRDVHIKAQFQALSQALRESDLRKPFSEHELAHAPYGLDWDMMHFACSQVHIAKPPRDRVFTKYVDENRAPSRAAKTLCNPYGYFCWDGLMEHAKLEDNERVIYPTFESVGLSAFAVTYTGAQRLLYQLSYKELVDTLDRSIAHLFMTEALRGWTIIPPIMGEFKIDGAQDTNLNANVGKLPDRKSNLQGHGPALRNSVRESLVSTWDDKGSSYWTAELKSWEKYSKQEL